jgi:hypothetical protein
MKFHGILRKFLALTLLTVSALVVSSSHTVRASSTTPPLGSWSWCTDVLVDGCIEAVTTVSPEKVSNTYTSAAELPVGLSVGANCSGNGPATSCDGNKFEDNADGVCVEKSSWAGGRTTPSIEIDINWTSRSGWEVSMRLSTGNFRPAFLIGHGTRSTQITSDGDGTFTFTFTSIIEFAYSAPVSQNAIPADIATFGRENVHVQLWPRDHLLSSYLTQPMGAPRQIGRGPCKFYPLSGAWAEANAQGFSWSYGTPNFSSGPPATDSPIASKFTFKASAPHYKPRVGSQALEVIQARVQIFLSTAYFRSLGYETVDEFDSNSYSVTTEDGQATTPTVTKLEGGLLINLGISHYSAPNPQLTFVVKGDSLTTSDSLASTPALIRRTATTVPQKSPAKVFTLRKGQTASSSRIARELGISLKSAKKIVLSISTASKKACKVSGLSVRTIKKGTCSVTLKVTAKNGKTKTYKQRITVS